MGGAQAFGSATVQAPPVIEQVPTARSPPPEQRTLKSHVDPGNVRPPLWAVAKSHITFVQSVRESDGISMFPWGATGSTPLERLQVGEVQATLGRMSSATGQLTFAASRSSLEETSAPIIVGIPSTTTRARTGESSGPSPAPCRPLAPTSLREHRDEAPVRRRRLLREVGGVRVTLEHATPAPGRSEAH